jgi:hypothetical protein
MRPWNIVAPNSRLAVAAKLALPNDGGRSSRPGRAPARKPGGAGPSAILRLIARLAQSGRVEELPLGLGADSMDDAGADLAILLQRAGDSLQERITQRNIERPGGRHHSIELGIG